MKKTVINLFFTFQVTEPRKTKIRTVLIHYAFNIHGHNNNILYKLFILQKTETFL